MVLLDSALTSYGMGVADGTVGTGSVNGRPWHFQAWPPRPGEALGQAGVRNAASGEHGLVSALRSDLEPSGSLPSVTADMS